MPVCTSFSNEFFFSMMRRPPRSTQGRSSAASDVYKRQGQLAVDYSCPTWLVEEWLASYGEEAALRMLAGSLGKAPVYLRANTLRTTPEALCERPAAGGAVSYTHLRAHETRHDLGCRLLL